MHKSTEHTPAAFEIMVNIQQEDEGVEKVTIAEFKFENFMRIDRKDNDLTFKQKFNNLLVSWLNLLTFMPHLLTITKIHKVVLIIYFKFKKEYYESHGKPEAFDEFLKNWVNKNKYLYWQDLKLTVIEVDDETEVVEKIADPPSPYIAPTNVKNPMDDPHQKELFEQKEKERLAFEEVE